MRKLDGRLGWCALLAVVATSCASGATEAASVSRPPEVTVGSEGGDSEATPVDATSPAAGVPSLPGDAVFRPEFDTIEGPIPAGSAFLVPWAGGTALVTAHHLFGPDGGMSHQYSAEELPDVVHGVLAVSADDSGVSVSSTEIVVLPEAKALALTRDLAAFRVERPAEATVLTLAEEGAEPGDHLWLLAELYDGSRPELIEVIAGDPLDGGLTYEFPDGWNADNMDRLAGTSGAPLVNERGQVVGTLIGGTTTPDGTVWGYGLAVTFIREMLDSGW